jgi:hypothetical protein
MEEADIMVFLFILLISSILIFIGFMSFLDFTTQLYFLFYLISFSAIYGLIVYLRAKSFGGIKEYLGYFFQVLRERKERREYLRRIEEEARAVGRGLGITERRPSQIIIKNVVFPQRRPSPVIIPDIPRSTLDFIIPRKRKKKIGFWRLSVGIIMNCIRKKKRGLDLNATIERKLGQVKGRDAEVWFPAQATLEGYKVKRTRKRV